MPPFGGTTLPGSGRLAEANASFSMLGTFLASFVRQSVHRIHVGVDAYLGMTDLASAYDQSIEQIATLRYTEKLQRVPQATNKQKFIRGETQWAGRSMVSRG
jgi:hypothetical protein